MPTISPPRGHDLELRDYFDQYAGFSCSISTFGFGYELDSKMLIDIAIEGNGTFHFIPCSVLVGTNFVNSMANILANFSQDSTLKITPAAGVQFGESIPGGHAVAEESWGR